jgi:hypothetical protein
MVREVLYHSRAGDDFLWHDFGCHSGATAYSATGFVFGGGRSLRRRTTSDRLLLSTEPGFGGGDPVYLIKDVGFSQSELEPRLAELHESASPESEIVFVLENSMRISDIENAPAAASKAEFNQ